MNASMRQRSNIYFSLRCLISWMFGVEYKIDFISGRLNKIISFSKLNPPYYKFGFFVFTYFQTSAHFDSLIALTRYIKNGCLQLRKQYACLGDCFTLQVAVFHPSHPDNLLWFCLNQSILFVILCSYWTLVYWVYVGWSIADELISSAKWTDNGHV